jgi:hypothetical protein
MTGSSAEESFERSREAFGRVQEWLAGPEAAGLDHAAVEEELAARGREAQRLLQDHLDARAAAELRLAQVSGPDGVTRTRAERACPSAGVGVRAGGGDPDRGRVRPRLLRRAVVSWLNWCAEKKDHADATRALSTPRSSDWCPAAKEWLKNYGLEPFTYHSLPTFWHGTRSPAVFVGSMAAV